MAEQQKNIESIYPLSPMQQGMLFHTLLSPKSGIYVNQVLYTLSGRLHEEAFQRAWQQAADRHQPLRTLFLWEGRDKPLQVVRQRVSLPWEQLDWRGSSAEEQNSKLTAFLQADRERGFDLARAPLMRLTLVRFAENHWELIWSHHHVLLDGWSLFLVLKDVMAIYQALSEGRDCRLEPVRPYQDYIGWLKRQDLLKAEGFWREALKGFAAPTPVLGSPLHEKHEDHDCEARDLRVRWPPSLMAALRAFASRHGLTLNTIVQAAWAILLSRYSGEEDIVFGSTVSGRPADLAGVESMVGLLINTLPVRAQFSTQDMTLSWLKSFQDRLVELRQYEYTPLVDVQSWSDVRRDRPLFESLIVFENYPVDASSWGKGGTLKISNMRVIGPVNFALSVVIVPTEEFSLRVNYDSRRFDADTVRWMLAHYQTLLEGIVANPERRLSELPLLTEFERKQLLENWNQTAVYYPLDRCVHELFEQQVERTPDAIAIVHDDAQLTYRELNVRANQLGHHLRSLGVQPDDRVAICAERSLDMVTGLLAILKAGAAYVPLDPTYPAERLEYMLEDSAPVVVLSRGRARTTLAGALAGLPNRPPVLNLEYAVATWADQPTANPDPAKIGLTSRHLAYVIYTSGSTGRPKGVAMMSLALVNLLSWQAADSPLTPGARVLQFASVGFDVAFQEILSTLTEGGTLVLISEDTRLDPEALLSVMRLQGVNRAFVPPAMLEVLADVSAGEIPPSLEDIFVAGEALKLTPAVRAMSAGNPRLRLHNHYGPTETHVTVADTLPVDPADWPVEPPIGRPIANTRIYLLDGCRQPVPIGVSGEIYIGGAGVARGYLNRPELTAERFISSPFVNGDRLYKTGDLGLYLADGKIEFLGRNDFQVKIRGFRIELAEIEAELVQHPAVSAAVVLLREDEPGDKRLVAYLTTKESAAPKDSELRALLREILPEYMIPSAFVILDRFPLTPNGKVDRKALPKPDLESSSAAEFAPPETETQKALAAVWREVLGIQQVGIHDNFFDLGGHSLLATRVTSRASATLGVRLPLRAMFEHPRLGDLAEQVDALLWANDQNEEPSFDSAAKLEEGIV